MAIGAASSAIQGGGFKEIAMGAAFGAVGGAVSAGGIGAGFTSFGNVFSGVSGQFLTGAASAAVQYGSAGAFLGSMVTGTGMFAQPDYSQFGYGAQPYETSSQHRQVTGSGGRQAAAVLASEIKQAKSLRKRQAEASEDYGLGMDMAGTGLQIA